MGRRDGIAPNPFVSGTHTHRALVCKRGVSGAGREGRERSPLLKWFCNPKRSCGLNILTQFFEGSKWGRRGRDRSKFFCFWHAHTPRTGVQKGVSGAGREGRERSPLLKWFCNPKRSCGLNILTQFFEGSTWEGGTGSLQILLFLARTHTAHWCAKGGVGGRSGRARKKPPA